MSDSPTGNRYTNGEMDYGLVEEDYCQYDDSGEFYATCIRQEHLDRGWDCAMVGDFELEMRLQDFINTLELVERQTRARTQHLPSGNQIRERLIRQHLSNARDAIRMAKTTLLSRS